MTAPEPGKGPTEWFEARVGVGPWEQEHPNEPRPTGPEYDEQLLDEGDRRNVVDAYRYWTMEAIVAELDKRRHPLHIAIENFENDSNIGTVVRTANAFLVVAVDNVPGSVPIETVELPERCLLLFGQEGPGVTEEAQQAADLTVSIAQFGSTRSINAGVAAGIAMHSWIRTHADITAAW